MHGRDNVKMPPEVKAVMEEWLRRKIRGQTPDFTDYLDDGTELEVTRIDSCCDGCAKVAQHYPYKKCIKDGLAKGLSKKEAEHRCQWIACCRSKRENRFKETGFCKDFDCDKEPEWGDKKASHSRSQCMESGCKKAPEIECIWANGYGRAWFCKPHFKTWSTTGDGKGDIIKQKEIPNGTVGEKYGEYPNGKTAKATGTKTGQGESVGLFIPLPKNLAKKFPSLGEEDTSPSHVTFLYIGDFPKAADQAKLLDILKESCRRFWPLCEARLGDLDYFDHEDKDRRVPHVKVEFDKDLAGFKHRIKQELEDAGVDVKDKFPEYKPHVTLAYMPGMDAEWKGKIPKGNWTFNEMEVWGLPKVHRLKLGPSIHKVSEDWLRKRFLKRMRELQRVKTAGWWTIDGSKPPVDKGKLMNAIPGCDPADAAMYTGDGPADHTGDYLDQIDIMYRTTWGRPAKPEELAATFDFSFGPVKDGAIKLNEWFDSFVRWLGIPATKIRWSLEIWDKIGWFFRTFRNEKYLYDNPQQHIGPKPPPLPDIWKTLDIVKDDLIRLNELEYATDTSSGSKFHDAVLAKFDTLMGYWMDTWFPKKLDDAERRLVNRITERWLKGR